MLTLSEDPIPSFCKEYENLRAMEEANQWIDCEPKVVLERGLVDYSRRYGRSITQIAGAMTILEPVAHPYSGGVMMMDWALGNKQESPIVLERYFKEFNSPWVWWSEKRHELEEMPKRMKWLGLEKIDEMIGMSFDVKDLPMMQKSEPFSLFISNSSKTLDGLSQIMQLSQGYSEEFTQKCMSELRRVHPSRGILHHLAYYRGKAVAAATLHLFPGYSLIMHLGVAPKMRGRGLAKLVLQELLATSALYRNRRVLAFVPAAIKPFFEARGFKSEVEFNIYGSEEIEKRLESAHS